MWTDKIGMICRKDPLIKDLGKFLLKYYTQDQEECKLRRTSAHMRAIARLLDEARVLNPEIEGARDLINNRYYSLVMIKYQNRKCKDTKIFFSFFKFCCFIMTLF